LPDEPDDPEEEAAVRAFELAGSQKLQRDTIEE
jgi:hypothetical protein